MTPEEMMRLETLTRQQVRATLALASCLEELFPPGVEVKWRRGAETLAGTSLGAGDGYVLVKPPQGRVETVEPADILRAFS